MPPNPFIVLFFLKKINKLRKNPQQVYGELDAIYI